MGADALVMQGATASATMILTLLNWYNLVPSYYGLKTCDGGRYTTHQFLCNLMIDLFMAMMLYGMFENIIPIDSPLRWRHNGHSGVSNHQPHHCLLNRLFECRSQKTSKLRVTGLCAGNSPGTGEFPAQMASNAENVSIWWRHHALFSSGQSFWSLNKIYQM